MRADCCSLVPSFGNLNSARSLLMVACLFLAIPASLKAAPADLSMLSDFGQADIAQDPSGLATQKAGIRQVGSADKAWIDQTGGIGNNAEVWQTGDYLSGDIRQIGGSNEVHLSQVGDHQNAVLDQTGIGNQMAIRQFESNADVASSQVGNYNQLVLQQYGNSQFQSSQVGDRNQIIVDLPNGMYLKVDQVGNDRIFSFH